MSYALKVDARRQPPVWGFGDRLRAVRREDGVTQAEMALKLGVGLKAYSAWESGASRPADMVRTAEMLEERTGIARSWWLGWDEMPGSDAFNSRWNSSDVTEGADSDTSRVYGESYTSHAALTRSA